MELEIRAIPGYPGYCVDNAGCVYGKDGRKRALHTKKHKPYLTVGLSIGGTTKTRLVHQLVLEAFIGPRPDGMEGRHLDGDRFNNRLDNLAWGTPKQNTADSIAHGTHHALSYVTKVLPAMRPALIEMRKSGATYVAIARRYGVSTKQARALANGFTSGRAMDHKRYGSRTTHGRTPRGHQISGAPA